MFTLKLLRQQVSEQGEAPGLLVDPLYPFSSPQGSFHLSLSLPQYLHDITTDLREAATPELSFQRLTNGSCWGSPNGSSTDHSDPPRENPLLPRQPPINLART